MSIFTLMRSKCPWFSHKIVHKSIDQGQKNCKKWPSCDVLIPQPVDRLFCQTMNLQKIFCTQTFVPKGFCWCKNLIFFWRKMGGWGCGWGDEAVDHEIDLIVCMKPDIQIKDMYVGMTILPILLLQTLTYLSFQDRCNFIFPLLDSLR